MCCRTGRRPSAMLPRVELDRPDHLAHAGTGERPDSASRRSRRPPRRRASRPTARSLAIANMLKAGITCFCDAGLFPARGRGRRGRTGPAGRDRPAGRGASERLGAEPRRISHAGTQAARRVQGPSVDLDPIRPASHRARSAMRRSRASRYWPLSSTPGCSCPCTNRERTCEVSIRLWGKRPLQRFLESRALGPRVDRRAR